MKKHLRMLVLILAMAQLLCLNAFAASGSGSVNPTVKSARGAEVSATFNAEYISLDVSFTNSAVENGKDYMIWVISGTKDESTGETVYIPTESSILYVGQATADGTTFSFSNVYPSSIRDSAILISGPGMSALNADGSSLVLLASIEVPYILGDANQDTSVDSIDALLILQVVAKVEGATMTEVGRAAGDVNIDGYVDAVDALAILQYRAGVIGSLPPENN